MGFDNANLRQAVPIKDVLSLDHQRVIHAAKVKVGMSEVPGYSLKKRLQKSDPFKERKCRDIERCMVCTEMENVACVGETV